jgi:hypothetical protein
MDLLGASGTVVCSGGMAWRFLEILKAAQRRSLVHEKQFVRLQKNCSKSLDTFHIESHQTLNLLASVNYFPHSMENKTALQFQLNREKRAQTDYRRRRRELLRLVPAELEHV